MLRVTPHPADLSPDETPVSHEVDYVSLVDAGTHGPPALIAPGRANGERTAPVVQPDETVLYINTGARDAYPSFEIERLS